METLLGALDIKIQDDNLMATIHGLDELGGTICITTTVPTYTTYTPGCNTYFCIIRNKDSRVCAARCEIFNATTYQHMDSWYEFAI